MGCSPRHQYRRVPASRCRGTGPTLATVVRRVAALVGRSRRRRRPRRSPSPRSNRRRQGASRSSTSRSAARSSRFPTSSSSAPSPTPTTAPCASASTRCAPATSANSASAGLVDVRYGIDAKYLDEGDQYLIGALLRPAAFSRCGRGCSPASPTFGGDEIIGADRDRPRMPRGRRPDADDAHRRVLDRLRGALTVLRQPRRAAALAARVRSRSSASPSSPWLPFAGSSPASVAASSRSPARRRSRAKRVRRCTPGRRRPPPSAPAAADASRLR